MVVVQKTSVSFVNDKYSVAKVEKDCEDGVDDFSGDKKTFIKYKNSVYINYQVRAIMKYQNYNEPSN